MKSSTDIFVFFWAGKPCIMNCRVPVGVTAFESFYLEISVGVTREDFLLEGKRIATVGFSAGEAFAVSLTLTLEEVHF